jgi:hypothetical protein
MTEPFVLELAADDAADAIARAKAIVRAQTALRLRTVGSCRPVPDQPGFFRVALVVTRIEPDEDGPGFGCSFCGGEGHLATAHDQSEVW